MNTTNVIPFDRVMRKDELIEHLNAEHFRKPIESRQRRYWTKDSLADHHRLAHIALGPSAAHRHGR